MKNKKFLACVLLVILVLSLLPVSALALTQAETGAVTHETIPFQPNPLYEGLISEADFIPAEVSDPEEGLSHTQPTTNAAKATYVSQKKAAEQMRGFMKSRTQIIDLYIQSSNSNYNELMNEVLLAALAHTGKPTEGDYLMWHYAGWSGTVDWEQVSGKYNYHFSLEMYYYTTAAQEKELDAAVSQLIKSLNLSGKSDYQKVCAVYDYICNNITYDYENLNNPNYLLQYTAYGALMNKTAVCQGYSNLLYRLLLELGIDNRIITGETLEGAHSWNIVKLGKVYYNVDATWDAILGDHSYFLRNSEGFADHYRYIDYMTIQFNRDYPISATDYVDGISGEPEFVFAYGMCGENAYWMIDRDLTLTIFGTGATDHYMSYDSPWHMCGMEYKKVVVEEGITQLGNYSFHDLPDLVSVSLPDSLELIGSSTFSRCTGLTQIVIPDNVVYIGSIFDGCENLKTVKLGNSVRSIGGYAFANCYALEQINFPDSLQSIDSAAFDYCNSLTELTIPATVQSVGGFRYCDNLETVHIHAKKISSYGFYNCKNLKNVVLYDTVEIINNTAFEGCDALETITVPASVTEFGMQGCHGLKTIHFLGDAPEFSHYAFDGTTATAYYPANNPTWTEAVMQNYQGSITWVPYTPGEAAGLLGDVSGDGIVDSYDAALVAMYDVYLIDETGLDLSVADVSGDGIVDSYDAALIAMYDVYLIPEFPAAS